MEKNNTLTSYQVFVLIVIPGFTAISELVVGRLTETASADNWISILLAGAIAALAVLVIISLTKRFANDSLFGFTEKLLGKALGRAVNMIYVVYSLALVAFCIRTTVTTIYNFGLRETPQILFIIFYLLPAVYISTKKFVVIGRIAELALVILVVVSFTLSVLNMRLNVDFFRPVGVSGLKQILAAVLPAQNTFIGLYALLFFFPLIKNKKTALKSCLAGVGFSTLVITFFFVVVVGFFGPKRASMFFWPPLKYLSTISTPIFERLDIIVMWLGPGLSLVAIFIGFYLAKAGINQSFRIEQAGKKYIVTGVLFIILIIITRFSQNYYQIIAFSKIMEIFGLLVNLIIPLVLLTISMLFKRRETE